eukprot:3959963-Amphidinium_carterae.1
MQVMKSRQAKKKEEQACPQQACKACKLASVLLSSPDVEADAMRQESALLMRSHMASTMSFSP